MATEESLHRTKPRTRLTELEEAEKWHQVDIYRAQFRTDCPCHCHLAVPCKCLKNCGHCRPVIVKGNAGDEAA